ncbi:hypothetical protein ILUMI_20289, partial [Ignelater luminosus]
VKIVAYVSVEHSWIHLTNITSKFCQFLRNYLGPVRKTVLTSVGLSENTCPIPKGSYRARNLNLNMRDSRIPMCPYGLFKVDATLNAIATDEMKLCFETLMENKPIRNM